MPKLENMERVFTEWKLTEMERLLKPSTQLYI